MRIRKIEEFKVIAGNLDRNLTFHLIIDEKDEGWELTQEEALKLHKLIKASLNLDMDQPLGMLEKTLDHSARGPLTVILDHENVESQEVECPEYIEPPEDNASEETIRLLPKEVTEKPKEASVLERDYTPYIDLLNLGKKPSEVMRKMEEDLNIGNGTARTYYYKNVHPYKDPEVTSESEDDPVAAKDPAEGSRLPKSLAKKIAEMPIYQTAREFVDATILQDIGQSKEVWELKAMYLKTHPNVRWR